MLLFTGLFLAGCTQSGSATPSPAIQPSTGGVDVAVSEKAVSKGDKVAVDYAGWTKDDGKVFDTSLKEEAVKANLTLRPSYTPLEFTVGVGQMIAGFDKGVVGMKVGEQKEVVITPEAGYGLPKPELIQQVPLDVLNKSGINASVGLKVYTPQGAQGTIIKVAGGNATVDFNHFLAGKTLVFKIILRKIG